MSKRLFTVFNLMLVAVFILTACASPATQTPAAGQEQPTAAQAQPTTAPAQPTTAPEQPTTAPEQPTTAPAEATTVPSGKSVKITIWHQWEGKYLDAISAAFKDYETAHPGVTIELSKPDNTNDALKVAIPAGQGPDIIGWANDNIGAQALAGNIVDLDSLGVDQAFLTSNFEPAAVKGVMWQDKIWALPESQEAIALVYNKAIMTDEFLPKDPSNLDDLLAKAKDFAAKNPGKFLVCNEGLGGKDAYHEAPIYFGSGIPTYIDETGKVYLNTPEALKAANWIVEFSKVAPKETSHDICKSLFTEGKVAAWWTGPWAIADIEAAKIDYGIQPMGKPFVGIKTLMITKNAVDRGTAETALDIMKYFTSADVEKKVAEANKTIPANTTALKDPTIQALPTVAGFGASANLGVPMSSSPYASAQWDPVGDATQAIWNGSQKPADALAAAQKAAEDKVASMK